MRLVCLLLLFLPFALNAQFTYRLDQSILVQDKEGNPLSQPWGGGLNAAQFNTLDLNNDGVDDLVLFDRMANKVITFLASENKYIAAPDYENLFPSGIYNWILLRDFNGDGRKDIFTGDVLGMKVYVNTTTTGGTLTWEPYLFSTGFGGNKSHVLLTKNPATGIKVNLQLQYDDLPSIGDVDGDGDLDIFNIQYAGSTVEFHQNVSMETYGSRDSLEFVRVTRTWGNFRECACGVFAYNGQPCPPNSGGRTKHAGGKSLLLLDVDGDQQLDVLFSEAECTRLFALPNKGTITDPIINSSYSFPQIDPVNFVLFPAAFYEDVDFDGKRDLIATPNIYVKEFFNSQLAQSTWFYKNIGSDAHPTFTLVQQNFLQGDMIDVGDNAVPAFADYNGDGLSDLLVSTHSSDQYTSRLYLFQNTGTPDNPSFKLLSDNYLGFSSSRFYNVKIQVADMDGNQTPDLIFTATTFDNGTTNLYYLTNKSQQVFDFGGTTVQRVDFVLTSDENIFIIDINGDGLPDLLAGRSEGNLEYWKNTGIPGSPSFTLEEDDFLGLGYSPFRQNMRIAVADLDADGNSDMVVGDHSGRVGIISDFRNASGEESIVYDLVFNTVMGSYQEKNFGGRAQPVVANLFNANKPALVVGNALGGIHILKHDDGTSLPERPQIHIYPNPALKDDILNIKSDRQGAMVILSVLGQQLSRPVALRANEIYKYKLPPLAAGMYLLKFTFNKKTYVERFIVR